MEETPYYKTETGNLADELQGDLQKKQAFLTKFEEAIMAGDDRQILEMIDARRYNMTVHDAAGADNNRVLAALVDDLRPKISHHVAKNLIAYLSEKFPFFFYEETEVGVFHLFFGDWWDRREFGVLDPFSVTFIFNKAAFELLKQSVELSKTEETVHATERAEIERLLTGMRETVAGQPDRDKERAELEEKKTELENKKGLFKRNGDELAELQVKLDALDATDKKAADLPMLIAKNEEQLLALEKEESVLAYEQHAIEETFGDFETFAAKAESLYADYVKSLAGAVETTKPTAKKSKGK